MVYSLVKRSLLKLLRVGAIALTAACLFTLGGLGYYSHATGTSFTDSGALLYASVTGIEQEKDHKSHGR
jgi:hypothetical protein